VSDPLQGEPRKILRLRIKGDGNPATTIIEDVETGAILPAKSIKIHIDANHPEESTIELVLCSYRTDIEMTIKAVIVREEQASE
jgi:hypothetical protein